MPRMIKSKYNFKDFLISINSYKLKLINVYCCVHWITRTELFRQLSDDFILKNKNEILSYDIDNILEYNQLYHEIPKASKKKKDGS